MSINTTRIGSDYEFDSPNEDWYQQLELIYAYNFLTDEECDVLIDLTTVVEGDNPGTSTGDTDYRKVKVIPLHYLGPNFTWLSDRIQEAIQDFNYQFYRFDINALDGLSLCSYRASDDAKYRPHIDCRGDDGLMRKLTVVIQLSDPDSYQGGETEILNGAETIPLRRDRGCINVFPSFLMHQVNPISQGNRHAVVTWVVGPPFR